MSLASWQTSAVNLGTANATPIVAQVATGTLASIVSVTLSGDYARAADPAYPVCDAGSRAYLSSPQTIPEGTVLEVYSDEAAALVAGGAASYT
jgi:hypothetical protein